MPNATCSAPGCDRPHHARGFCSRCYKREAYNGRIPPGPTREERFWAKVEKTDTCWLWTGGTQRGYGAFNNWPKAGMARAHRLAYEWLIGPIPDGLHIDHVVCGIRICVNPAHMEPVTNAENVRRSALRTAAARRAAATHCSNAHEWTEANASQRRDNAGRRCKQCQVEATRRYLAKKLSRSDI